ncbi:MAG: fluoride efflux transporter FluC [Micromonosporaceae bacterium]
MSGTRVLAAISAGGALGSALRYGVTLAWPASPWATLTTNLVGCALIGVLMVLITEAGAGPALLRPFLGIGVLGGFTTFSAYAVGVVLLARDGQVGVAAGYLVATVLGALVATWLGIVGGRRLVAGRRLAAGRSRAPDGTRGRVS